MRAKKLIRKNILDLIPYSSARDDFKSSKIENYSIFNLEILKSSFPMGSMTEAKAWKTIWSWDF